MKGDNNNNIIERIKKGDTTCLEELVVAHKSYCTNGLKKKVRCSDDEAEELFIEALLELRDKIITGKLEHLINVKSYLFGICYNMWLATQRSKKRKLDNRKDIEIYYQQYLEEDFLFMQEGNRDYKMELINIAHQALGKLGEKCRMIIKYFYLESKSMDEIADLMGFANAAVAKTSKSRCFKTLVEKVKELE